VVKRLIAIAGLLTFVSFGFGQLLTNTYGTIYTDLNDIVQTLDAQNNANTPEFYADELWTGYNASVSDVHSFSNVTLTGVPGVTMGEENAATSMSVVNLASSATVYSDFTSSADISTTVTGANGFASASGACNGDSFGQFGFVLTSATTIDISGFVTADGPGPRSLIEIYGITNDFTVLEQNAPDGKFETTFTVSPGYYLIDYYAYSSSQFSCGAGGMGDLTGLTESGLDLTTTFTPAPEPATVTLLLAGAAAVSRRRRDGPRQA
jgi:hypothetical protein